MKGPEVKGLKVTIRREFRLYSKPHYSKDFLKNKQTNKNQTKTPSQVSALDNPIVGVMLEMKYRLKTLGLISIHLLCFLQEVFTEQQSHSRPVHPGMKLLNNLASGREVSSTEAILLKEEIPSSGTSCENKVLFV